MCEFESKARREFVLFVLSAAERGASNMWRFRVRAPFAILDIAIHIRISSSSFLIIEGRKSPVKEKSVSFSQPMKIGIVLHG